MAVISATQLRANIYQLLDQVAQTGEAIEIERKGTLLRIVPAERRTLAALFPPDPELIRGDPADLASLDHSDLWSEDDPARQVP